MKRYILIALILAGILLAFQFANAHASNLRDFRDTQELEAWLKQTTQNKPPIVLVADANGVVHFKDFCVPATEAFIARAGQDGYGLERFTIVSTDYYRYWYNAELPYRALHGVALAKVGGRDYLIETLSPIRAWELTEGWAGRKVDSSWQ